MNGFKHILLLCMLCLLALCRADNGQRDRQIGFANAPAEGPLCYSCDLLTDPTTCYYKVRCGRDEVCMLHEIMPGADGRKRYTAHCETDIVCQSMRNHAKRGHVFCHNCCKQDLCNNHCGETPTKPPTLPSTSTVAPSPSPTTVATTTAPPVTTTKSATTTHPIIYPIMCYSCNAMLDPGDCKHLVTCASGHGCMLQATGQNIDRQTLYKSSCEPDWLCNAMSRSVSLVGKREETNYSERRSEIERRSTNCNKCCRHHLCNNHCDVLTPTTTKQTTTDRPTTTTKPTTTLRPTTTTKPTTTLRPTTTTKPTTTLRPTTTTKPTTTAKPTTTIRPTTATRPTTTIRPTTTARPTTTTKQLTPDVFSATTHPTTQTALTHAQSTVHTNTLSQGDKCTRHNFTSIPYVKLCFKLEAVDLAWSIAERWCGFYGATLAVLDDPAKFSVIQAILKYESHFSNQVAYIGGYDRYDNSTFYWPGGDRISLGSWSGLNFHHTTGRCMSLDGTNGFEMKFVDCFTYRKFICSIDMS